MTNVNTDGIDQGFVLGNKVLVAEVFARNGFLVLSSATGEGNTTEVNADQIDQDKGSDTLSATIPWKHSDLQRV
jgi:hypothetical protein